MSKQHIILIFLIIFKPLIFTGKYRSKGKLEILSPERNYLELEESEDM